MYPCQICIYMWKSYVLLMGRHWGEGVKQSTSKLLFSHNPFAFSSTFFVSLCSCCSCSLASFMCSENSYTINILVTPKASLQTALQNNYLQATLDNWLMHNSTAIIPEFLLSSVILFQLILHGRILQHHYDVKVSFLIFTHSPLVPFSNISSILSYCSKLPWSVVTWTVDKFMHCLNVPLSYLFISK